ncbi:MAG: hypothetical protein RL365_64 [Bacteroidota bacterium]|jgi:hypothetical protein
MKKLLLSVSALFLVAYASTQVICKGISPAAIAGNYTFTWADPAIGWGTPDFLIPNTWVEDTLMLVEDGTPGTNPQGNPISQEGCDPLINDLTGKIAVVFRNTCEFGAKAINAQNAGAVGVIIVNRNPGEWINMGPGAAGANVTIPVVMLDLTDGMNIIQEMANGPVVMFIGNKIGLNPNDAGMLAATTLIPKQGGVVSFLAQNGSEFNFDLGTRIYNFGNQAQSNVSLNATVTDPSGNVVYNNSVNGLNINASDSVDVDPTQANTLPQFSMASYPMGRYTLTYTVALDTTADDDPSDNSASYDFVIQDSLYTFANLDVASGNAVPTAHYRPSTNNATYSICTVLKDANASRIAATGLHFSATTLASSGVTLDGEEIALNLYKWEDNFTDLNDANFGFNILTQVAGGYYYYPSDLQGSLVYGAFDQAVVLEDNVRYLACAQTVNLDVYLGFESSRDHTWNYNYYAQPMSPIESDGTYYAAGFGTDIPNALVLHVIDANHIGLDEVSTVKGMAYPNPTADNIDLTIDGEGAAQVVITDIAGKIVSTRAINLVNGTSNYSLEGLTNGIYIFNVTLENGKTAQFNVVKK